MSSKCFIKFDQNPDRIYHSGDLLRGYVELTTSIVKIIRAIHVSIIGYSKVRWKQQRIQRGRGNKMAHTVVYCSNQQYIATRTYLVGEEGGDSFELLPSTYIYKFQTQLPNQMPSSFEGQFGHIRYEVILRIDRPWKFDNLFKQPFTIIAPLNLNLDPVYKLSKERCIQKKFCCVLCGSQKLTAKVNIPISGYASGQNINFILGIKNASSVNCTDIKVTLEKTTCYTSHYPATARRYDHFKIIEKYLGSVSKRHQKEFRDYITLPAIPPSSSVVLCKIIQVTYRLNFDIKISGCHRDLDISVPVVIGTVPLAENNTNMRMCPTAPQLSFDSAKYTSYSGHSPPSYEEAIRMGQRFFDEEEDKHHTEKTYMPKYPVYYNCETPSP